MSYYDHFLYSKTQNHLIFSTEGFRPQYFSLPSDVIKFVLKNISWPRLYQKLIQTCKYFYSKKRVVLYTYGVLYDSKSSEWITQPLNLLESKSYQLWFEMNLNCDTYGPQHSLAVSKLLERVYKCHFDDLHLKRQQLTFDEYLLLTSSKWVRKFSMTYMTICYQDGSHVPFEKLMEQLPYVFSCKFFPSSNHETYFTSETAKNLTKLPTFTDMRIFQLCRIGENFDYSAFCEFIKKNSKYLNNDRRLWPNYSIMFYYTTSEKYRIDFEKAVEEK